MFMRCIFVIFLCVYNKKKIEMFIFNIIMSEHANYNHYIYNVIYIILKTSNFNGF